MKSTKLYTSVGKRLVDSEQREMLQPHTPGTSDSSAFRVQHQIRFPSSEWEIDELSRARSPSIAPKTCLSQAMDLKTQNWECHLSRIYFHECKFQPPLQENRLHSRVTYSKVFGVKHTGFQVPVLPLPSCVILSK